jgi:hypothetical protein
MVIVVQKFSVKNKVGHTLYTRQDGRELPIPSKIKYVPIENTINKNVYIVCIFASKINLKFTTKTTHVITDAPIVHKSYIA